MSEQTIQSNIIKFLEGKDAYVVKVVSASKKGVPDLLACYKGLFIGIEVKTPKTKSNTSMLQKYNLDCIRECGGISMVACSVSEVEDVINTL